MENFPSLEIYTDSKEIADSKSRQKKYKMSLGSLIVPGSEETIPDK